MKKILLALSLLIAAGTLVHAQKLDKFGADLGKKSIMGKDLRLPYSDVLTYYGYIKPGATPDETRDGKKFYYLYLWIPAAAPELGIRMVSPVPEGMKPAESDFVSASYKENESDTKSYFDTWVTLERSLTVLSADKISTGASSKWISYGTNDDSGELPAQPSGSKYNSVLRITSSLSDPLNSLVVGLYRIGFTSYKAGEVQGGFVAQVGAPIKLPGICIAPTLEELAKLVKK